MLLLLLLLLLCGFCNIYKHCVKSVIAMLARAG
jgi:hypothetical protein